MFKELLTEAIDSAHNREADRLRDAQSGKETKGKDRLVVYKSKKPADYGDITYADGHYWDYNRLRGKYEDLGTKRPKFNSKLYTKAK